LGESEPLPASLDCYIDGGEVKGPERFEAYLSHDKMMQEGHEKAGRQISLSLAQAIIAKARTESRESTNPLNDLINSKLNHIKGSERGVTPMGETPLNLPPYIPKPTNEQE
jgi:hypothetical protein